MSYKSIINKIDELRTIVGSWSDRAEPASLEMDMALDRVKCIYEMLRFPAEEQQEVVEEVIEEEIQEEIQQPTQEIAPEIEITQPEPTEEEVVEDEKEVVVGVDDDDDEEEEEMHIDLVNVTPSSDKSTEEDEKELKKNRLNKILSLYESDEEIEEEEKEEEVVEEAQEEKAVTTQTITIERVTVETTVAEPVVIEAPAEQEVENPLFDLICLNDRLLLSHELFSGDEAQLIEALHALDLQPTLDDAMIYIAENYSWSGDNEGAQLLMSLLQNRYL